MAVKIRLTRLGDKKSPFYRVIVADSRSPRDGKFIDILGTYNPLTNPAEIKIDNEIIEPTQATITYQSVIDNQRNNNEEINSTIINESSLNMQATFPINNSNTYIKARSVMFGLLPKNTKFNVSLEFADGFRTEIEMVMPSNALSLERSTLTTCTINLSK